MEPPYVTKEKVAADQSVVIGDSDSYQMNSKEQTMDVLRNDRVLFSTPLVSRRDDHIQENSTLSASSICSVDSGFSDTTLDSTWTSSMNDALSLSAQSFPDSEDSCHRQALKVSDDSPINRGSLYNFNRRRLKFNIYNLHPPPYQLNEMSMNDSAICIMEYQETKSLCEEQTKGLSFTEQSASLCNCENTSRSLHFINADDLKVSIQEMAIDELQPSLTETITIPDQFCESCRHNCHVAEQKILSHLSNGDMNTISRFKQHKDLAATKSLKLIKNKCHPTASQTRTCDSSYSSQNMFRPSFHIETHRAETETTCFIEPSSTVANQGESHIKTHNVTVQHDNFIGPNSLSTNEVPETFQDNETTSENYSCESCPVCFNYMSPQTTRCQHDFAIINNSDKLSTLITPLHKLHKSHPKRSSKCDKDICFISSPNKIRKTDSSCQLCMDDERPVIESSSKKCASIILNEEGESLPTLGGMILRSNQAQHCCASHHQPALTSTKATTRDELKSNNMCNTKVVENTDFAQHLHSEDSDIIYTETTPGSTLNIRESVLQRVIKEFSPPEPTLLIGRNVGVRKVDIMQELFSKNIRPGLERIFLYLANADFISIASVSNVWKQALYSDKKAYNRYRQYKRSLSKNSIQHVAGKENCGEKPLNASSEPSLTEPRGLLSSMQSQATRKVVPEPRAVASVQDTLMSDDMLRICPRCQGPAMIQHHQDRATCMSEKCSYDFCTLCFASFHHPRQCKPLCKAPSKGDVAGTRKSKKNLKRL